MPRSTSGRFPDEYCGAPDLAHRLAVKRAKLTGQAHYVYRLSDTGQYLVTEHPQEGTKFSLYFFVQGPERGE